MTFTVTYRGANGAPVTETVEAADRADCLAQLKARGIAAMGVKEGGGRDGAHASSAGQARPSTRNGQPSTLNSQPSTRTRRRSIVPYVVSVAFVAFVAGGIWWWLGRDKARPSQDDEPARKKTALAKEVKPAAAPKPVEKAPEAPKVAVVDPRYEVPEGAYRDERGVLRRPGGMRILEKPPARTIELGNDTQPRVFSNMVDHAIAVMLKSLTSGSPVMLQASGYGPHFMRNLERALKEPIEIYESDSEEVRQLKRDVQAVHDELNERVAQGENAVELLRDARRQVYEVNMYRHRLRGEIAKYSQKEDVTEQDCKDFVAAANELLAERGAKPLALPGLVARAMRNAESTESDMASGDVENEQMKGKGEAK